MRTLQPLGKKMRRWRRWVLMTTLQYVFTELIVRPCIGSGPQPGRAQEACGSKTKPGASPCKPLQEHQSWGTNRSD